MEVDRVLTRVREGSLVTLWHRLPRKPARVLDHAIVYDTREDGSGGQKFRLFWGARAKVDECSWTTFDLNRDRVVGLEVIVF